jgi:two-component system, sensor histidine kinase PdtaS
MKKFLFYFILLLGPLSLPAQEEIVRLIQKAILTGKTDSAAANLLFTQASDAANKANNPYLAGKAFYESGEMYFNHKNHNRSFGAFYTARDHFTKVGANKEIAFANFGMGRQQYYRGNYKVAAGHLNFAMRGAKLMQLPQLESDALEYLGILYHVMPGTTRQSIDHFKRSILIKEKLNDRKSMLRLVQKLAGVFCENKLFDSALHYLNQSIHLATALQLPHDTDISRLNRAGTLTRLNKLTEAQKDLEYIAAKIDTTDLNITIRYFIQKGNFLVAQEKFEEANLNYNNALAVAGRIGVAELYGMVYKHMSEAYSYQGRYREAYQFAQQYNDHFKNYYAENVGTIKELEYIFSNAETKDEVTYLSGENTLKELRLQNERQLRWLLLVGIGAFLLLTAAIFYLYRKQINKNLIIKKQAEDLQTLMKEIHHRVKNNLQIISSLLDVQLKLIKDKQAAYAIKDGRNRVQSMALIHQNLYGEKHVTGIAVDEYIRNLAQSLFHSYNIRPGQVDIKMDIEKLELDVDTVIPIGLMLNELISNSLKHAFENGNGGLIEVVLKKCDGLLLLQVKDNGKGFPGVDNIANPTSFGMRMIKIFAQKLKADLDIYNDQGACVTMRIKKYKMAG